MRTYYKIQIICLGEWVDSIDEYKSETEAKRQAKKITDRKNANIRIVQVTEHIIFTNEVTK